MTFTEALKKLAELFPEKFEIDPHSDVTNAAFWLRKKDGDGIILMMSDDTCDVTQDKVDEILSPIGWEWWPYPFGSMWGFCICGSGKYAGTQTSEYHESRHTSKLLAAQAALIAVVTSLTQEGK